MARRTFSSFSFEGGRDLTTMGASWFVSYAYYRYVDRKHDNWNRVSTYDSRASVFTRTKEMHKYWLQKIGEMNDSNLATNTIGLTGSQVKLLAVETLKRL